jgi:hypothetical protein
MPAGFSTRHPGHCIIASGAPRLDRATRRGQSVARGAADCLVRAPEILPRLVPGTFCVIKICQRQPGFSSPRPPLGSDGGGLGRARACGPSRACRGISPGINRPSMPVTLRPTRAHDLQPRIAALDASMRGIETYRSIRCEMSGRAPGRFQGLVPATVWRFESPFGTTVVSHKPLIPLHHRLAPFSDHSPNSRIVTRSTPARTSRLAQV